MHLQGRNGVESLGFQGVASPSVLRGRLAGNAGAAALGPGAVPEAGSPEAGPATAASLPGRLGGSGREAAATDQVYRFPPPTLPGRLGNRPPGTAAP